MSKKINNKTELFGYRLKLNLSGEKGWINWTDGGFLFISKYDALEHRIKRHPNVKKWLVEPVRLNLSSMVKEN